MSANIRWKPVTNDGKDLGVSAPSAFIRSMKAAFGEEPWTLSPTDHQKLFGMAAVYGGMEQDNPYLNLVKVMGSQSIRVWAEY